ADRRCHSANCQVAAGTAKGNHAVTEKIKDAVVIPTKRAAQRRNLLSYMQRLVVAGLLTSAAFAQSMSKGIMSPPANVRPPYLTNVGIEQHLDGQVPADLAFVDDTGHPIKLGDYF